MKVITKYIYGSGNSQDVDILYIVDQLPETIAECKKFCVDNKGENENLNLATIKNGRIDSCFKGTVDELNNAVYSTWNLHDNPPLIIEGMVERDIYLKCIRAVRSILSHFSKSFFREMVKSALRDSWDTRLNVLSLISLSSDDVKIDFNCLNNNMTGSDVLKLVAFQIGQTKALIDGVELFTKDEVGERYPILAPFLKRESEDWITLSKELEEFVNLLNTKSIIESSCDFGNPLIITFIDKNGNHTYDLQSEKKL